MMLLSFSLHTCLLSSVAFLYRSFRKEHTWFSSQFERGVTKCDVYFSCVGCGNFGLVNDVLDVAVSIQGTRVWFPAVVLFFIIVSGSVNFGLIEVGYNIFDVIHATVT